MTPPSAPQQFPRRAPWALWTTLLAMLLALQVSAGAIRPAALVETGAVAAKLTLPAPLAAQFRDSGHALKAAGQRLTSAKPHDGQDGAAPPLLARSLSLAAPEPENDLNDTIGVNAPLGAAPTDAYRARAPPLSA